MLHLCNLGTPAFVTCRPSSLSPAEDEPLLPEIPKCDENILDTTVVIPGSWLSNTFRSILTHRPFVSEFHNFLRGLQLHTDYLQNTEFSRWKGNPAWLLPEAHLCLEEEADVKVVMEKECDSSSDHVHWVEWQTPPRVYSTFVEALSSEWSGVCI